MYNKVSKANQSSKMFHKYLKYKKKYNLLKGGANDELHVIVIDEDGLFTGTRNTVLERFEGLSKASDARGLDGETIFYKDVINSQSKYIYWTDHPAGDSTRGNAQAGQQ